MTIESFIGIISGVITIGLAVPVIYGYVKKQPMTELMNQLVDKKMTNEQHRKTLRKMNRRLVKYRIKNDYIQEFVLNDRGKETVFMDICESNDIEPTEEICKKFLNADLKKFRADYYAKRKQNASSTESISFYVKSSSSLSLVGGEQTVYMSELLMSMYPETCKNLIAILEKHNVNYSFIKGTKDIWCRDYMPVQTKSGKFIQFKYDPSYLKGKKEWEESRTDVQEVCKLNNIEAHFSNINIDGGNVLICDGRAILSDRIFSENPDYEKDSLINELSKLLECEIIIIPAQNGDYTGHADGMVRFVNRNTILGNRLADEYNYWQKGMQKVLDEYNLTYIDVPFLTDMKDRKHPESAIGIYVNYLEVNNLIVVPVFGRDEDKQSVDIIQKAFPDRIIETINYNDVAQEGGLLNCTTWVVNNK
ncbi:MAG: agmatine deiminase family protein [Bacteroidales bacterium]|nr:agmatine deiminase family protein [Bacteroidales bacterium]